MRASPVIPLAYMVVASIALPAAAGGAVHVVDQVDLTFVPDDLTVAPGDTVRWVWSDGFHTVTSGSDCVPDEEFFNEPLWTGNPIVEYTVPEDFEGDIPYLCLPHCDLDMVAMLRVRPGEGCPGDIDGSGTVDTGDLIALLAAWGPCPEGCPEDVDGNLVVDVADLLIVLAAWGPCP